MDHTGKKPYIVYIQEHYHKSVVVWAEDMAKALDAAESLCDSGAIDLERNTYAGRQLASDGFAKESALGGFDQYEA